MTFLVVRLCEARGLFQHWTDVLGRVELRPPSADFDDERDALTRSASAFGRNEDLDMDHTMRAATLVEADSLYEADEIARERFEVAVDLVSLRAPGISRHAVADVGFVRDLATGRLTHTSPRRSRTPSTTFAIMQRKWAGPDLAQWIASVSSGADLSVRLLRALRWKRLAEFEPNPQLQLLFQWFAIEAALRVHRDEDIVSWIMAFIGFPGDAVAQNLSPSLRDRLHAVANYRSRRDQVRVALERVRGFRDATVHEGFRPQDVAAADLRAWRRLIGGVAPRMIGTLETALQRGFTDAVTMRRNAAAILEAPTSIGIVDALENFLFWLDQPQHLWFDM